MIRAAHNPVFGGLFRKYIFRELRKNFQAFYLLNEFPSIPENKGLLITPNHFSWWDGFFIDYLGKRLIKRRLYLMMLEEQLERYRFFRMLGAYSVDPGNISSVMQSLQYTKEQIMDPSNYVVLYPQGVLEPYDKRPLNMKRGGMRYLVRHAPDDFLILPVGFRVTYHDQKHPEVSARMGHVIESETVKNDFGFFKQQFRQNIDELDKGTFAREFIRELFRWKS